MTRLTEEDVKYRYITPAIEKANWQNNQIMMEYSFTDGQIMVRGETVIRGKNMLLKSEKYTPKNK